MVERTVLACCARWFLLGELELGWALAQDEPSAGVGGAGGYC